MEDVVWKRNEDAGKQIHAISQRRGSGRVVTGIYSLVLSCSNGVAYLVVKVRLLLDRVAGFIAGLREIRPDAGLNVI